MFPLPPQSHSSATYFIFINMIIPILSCTIIYVYALVTLSALSYILTPPPTSSWGLSIQWTCSHFPSFCPFAATLLLIGRFLCCFRAYNIHITVYHPSPCICLCLSSLFKHHRVFWFCWYLPNSFGWISAFINFLRKSHGNNAVWCSFRT